MISKGDLEGAVIRATGLTALYLGLLAVGFSSAGILSSEGALLGTILKITSSLKVIL